MCAFVHEREREGGREGERGRERNSHYSYITQVFELTVAVQKVLMNSTEIYKIKY